MKPFGGGGAIAPKTLDGFVDSLLQAFENCRPGLPDETIEQGLPGVERFFLAEYEKEVPRLRDTVRVSEWQLSESGRAEYLRKVDDYIRKVVIPAYSRAAARVTPGQRNDFYLTPEAYHVLERVGWTLGGILTGSFVIWAPFIPIWDKYFILPFAGAGLFFPNIRSYLRLRRYESELNDLVHQADGEIARIDMSYLSRAGGDAESGFQASPARETPSGRAESVQASPARETPSGRAESVQASPARETAESEAAVRVPAATRAAETERR